MILHVQPFFCNEKNKNNNRNWMDFCLENMFNLNNFWCMYYARMRYVNIRECIL